jgi:phage terminase small subunit
MTATPHKNTRDKRRELAPIDDVDAQDGPAMKALPTDRHRAFVRALYQVKPGHGANVKAAKLAGFGTPSSSPQSMATIASRLAHDERVLAAIHEEDEKRIRASAPRALSALSRLIEDPKAKDHARGIAMVLDRVHPAEMVHKVKHEHDVTLNAMETAQILKRIAELSAKFSISLPAPMRQIGGPVIDGKATLISQSGGGQ